MASVSLLSTRGLVRRFGGLTAIDHVDFDLPEGEIRAVIGPNGAGKTTFVSLLSGRIAPSAGQVFFDGQDVTRMSAHRRVGLGIAYTFQITSVFGGLSLFDNVALAVQRKHGTRGLRMRVLEVLNRVGLADRADALAANQSYGHQRLLEVAMGLALQPRLLILDEPTQGLDASEIKGFIALVRAVANDSTILLIEHNMPVVMDLAQRITVLNQGTVLAAGTPEEVKANKEVQKAYLGADA